MIEKKRYNIGDACICWSLGEQIDTETSALVLSIYRELSGLKEEGKLVVLDLVPSYKALAIHFDPLINPEEQIIPMVEEIVDQQIEAFYKSGLPVSTETLHVLPVEYSGEDLPRVAELNGLSVEQVIDLHKKPRYTVAMIGFLPHYPYLIGLDPRLETPRLDSPRTKIPGGSVAIGGAQAGIYPRQSPGGWNLIGTTDPSLLKSIQPGDHIRFQEAEKL